MRYYCVFCDESKRLPEGRQAWSKESGIWKQRLTIYGKIAMLNTMIDSLSDVLEAKGITTQAEWEKEIKENLSAK